MGRISDIELFKPAAYPVLAIRKQVKLIDISKVVVYCYSLMTTYMNELGETLTSQPYMCFYNMESMDMNDMDIEIRFPIVKPVPNKGDIECNIIPEQRVVSCMYQGDYTKVWPTYKEMLEWIKENGYEQAGYSYETFYNGMDYPVEKLLTYISIPLK